MRYTGLPFTPLTFVVLRTGILLGRSLEYTRSGRYVVNIGRFTFNSWNIHGKYMTDSRSIIDMLVYDENLNMLYFINRTAVLRSNTSAFPVHGPA